MCRFLERSGHKGVESGNGMDGMVALADSPFDLIICAIMMPVQDGIETIQRIRILHPNIPIMAVCGAPGAEKFSLLDQAIAVGADMALGKPFRMMKFVAAVEGALSHSHHHPSSETGPAMRGRPSMATAPTSPTTPTSPGEVACTS